jgi:3-hydroxyisobutyrate dehydrogenase-like beta-hydroxyacid dehydrogenase
MWENCGATNHDYSPQFPLRLMNKDFRLIRRLATAVGAQIPAAQAALRVNAAQLKPGNEQDFSGVILQMEKQAHLDSADEKRIGIGAGQ